MSKTIFCPECHKITAVILRNAKGTKVVQNGKVLINLPAGSSGNTLVVQCPDGHKVEVKV